MSRSAQIIIVILLVLLGGSVFMVLSTIGEKQILQKTKKDLEDQLTQSQTRETKLIQDSRKFDEQLKGVEASKNKIEDDLTAANEQVVLLSDQVKSLTGQVDTLSKERDDWKSRVDGIRKERDDLMIKLQTRQQSSEAQPAPVVAQDAKTKPLPPGSDERYWADVLKQKADLSLQLEKMKSTMDQKLLEIEGLKGKNSELEFQVKSLSQEKEDIAQQIQHGENLASSLSLELARAKNDRKFDSDKVSRIQQENNVLRVQIKNLLDTKMGLERTIVRLNDEKTQIQRKLGETERLIQNRIEDIWQVKDGLDAKVASAKPMNNPREVELSPIVVSAPAPAVAEAREPAPQNAAPGINGKVISINKENNFVIVDLGEASGVQTGDSLGVYRGNKYIASLEIIQVRKDISAADIREKSAQIRVGDSVK